MFFSYIIDALFPPRGDKRIEREADEKDVVALLSPMLVEVTNPPTIAPLPFRDKTIRALIHEAKYHENARAHMLLAAVLSEYLTEIATDLYEHAVLIPMPLSSARKRERGFNQCEVVATRALATFPKGTITLAANVLRRIKDTEHQTRLSQTLRKHNLEDAFAVQGTLDPLATYILFDDVITTGATMQSAIDTLTKAGAKHILPLSLAH
ncbi:MAG: hypothetical protein WAV21_02110 [Minisyncoccia bacterium]